MDLSNKVSKELNALEEKFKGEKERHDAQQKKIDEKKGLRYRWNKFTGAYQKEVQHSYHEWIQKVAPRQQANSKSMALAIQEPFFKDIQQKHQKLAKQLRKPEDDKNPEDNNSAKQLLPQIDELLKKSPEAMKKEGLFFGATEKSYTSFQEFYKELDNLKKAIIAKNDSLLKESIPKVEALSFIKEYDTSLKQKKQDVKRYSGMADKVANDLQNNLQMGEDYTSLYVNLYALQSDIRRTLQQQSNRGRSSSVELTKSSTESLLADPTPRNAQKTKTGSPNTGPARH